MCKNLKLETKMMAAFGLMASIVLGLGLVEYYCLERLDGGT